MIRISALCFGAGSMAKEILPSIRPEYLDIKAFIDDRPHTGGTSFAGKPIIGLNTVPDYAVDYILVACRPQETATAKLRERGIPAAKIVSLDFEKLLLANPSLDPKERYGVPAAHLRNFPGLEAGLDISILWNSPWLAYLLPPLGAAPLKRFCPVPFTCAWIEHGSGREYPASRAGDVNLCRRAAVENPAACAGNIMAPDSFEDIWNSERARRFRASILDGSFRYCPEGCCPEGEGNRLPFVACMGGPELKKIIAAGTTAAPPPEAICLDYDEPGGIACPQCPTGVIADRGVGPEQIKTVHAHALEKLRNPARLVATGNGDALASPVFPPFLRAFDEERFPGTKITLRTNGLLFNERVWRSIRKAHPHIDQIIIAMDAATEKTHARVWTPGSFDTLLKNLEFIRHVKQTEVPFSLTLSFCVQRKNYREMGEFADMAGKCGADAIWFSMLPPGGSPVDAAYAGNAVHLPAHPEHQAFLRELDDPRLKNPRVFLECARPVRPVRQGGEKERVSFFIHGASMPYRDLHAAVRHGQAVFLGFLDGRAHEGSGMEPVFPVGLEALAQTDYDLVFLAGENHAKTAEFLEREWHVPKAKMLPLDCSWLAEETLGRNNIYTTFQKLWEERYSGVFDPDSPLMRGLITDALAKLEAARMEEDAGRWREKGYFAVQLDSPHTKFDFSITPPVYKDFGRVAQLNLLANEIRSKKVPGSIAEVGVFRGRFAKFIRKFFPERLFYLFDTFEGFDTEQLRDDVARYKSLPTAFPPVSMEELFTELGTPENCVVKKGLFPATAHGIDDTFCFVSLDADLYQPTLDGLNFFYSRLSRGGYIMVHDYGNAFYGGVECAVRAFCDEMDISYVPICDLAYSCVIGKQGHHGLSPSNRTSRSE